MKNEEVGLGIIGLGERGRIHLQNCLHLKDAKLVAVADSSKKAIKYARDMNVKDCYSNYEDLLKNEAIDAVVISLPNFLHLESAVKASEAGKDIFLEKPLAPSSKQGEKILSSVAKNKVKLMLGYDMRFKPKLWELREKISDGFFGEVEVAQATIVGSGPFSERRDARGPAPVPDWWFSRELVGGGALLDIGCHMIDLFSWFFGQVESAHSHLDHKLNLSVEDLATCTLRFKNGPIAIVNAGWFSRDRISLINICGTSKNVALQVAPSSSLGLIWTGIKKKLGWLNDDSDYLGLKNFVECLHNDESPHPSGEEGLVNLQIIEAAYRNAS